MLDVRRLVWDDWNIAHIARHNVMPEEVDEACHGESVQLAGKKGRIIVLGRARSGKVIAVVLDPETDEGVYYPVTARPASHKERRYYEQRAGGGKI